MPTMSTNTPTTQIILLSYKEALKQCKKENKSLLLSRTEDEDDDIIYGIGHSLPEFCKRTFLGYFRLGPRCYSRVDITMSRGSLEQWPHAGKDPDRRCTYKLTIIRGKIDRRKTNTINLNYPTSTNATKNMLATHRKKDRQTADTTYDIAFENAKKDVLKEKGLEEIYILPYDPSQPPEGVDIENIPFDGSVVTEVLAVCMLYLFKNECPMGYRSNRLIATDPEHNSLVYGRVRDNLLPHPCEDNTCVHFVD